MNNIKNIMKNIFSAIGEKSTNNELFVIIALLMVMMLSSVFGLVFMGIWYIIPNCLSSILLFEVLYDIFSVSTSIVLSIMTIVGLTVWSEEKENK